MDTSNKELGVYHKFNVNRVDGRDKPGGDKENARYYVLDYVNDKFALEALKFYAFKCYAEYPQLSTDIWGLLNEKAPNE